MTMRRTLTTSLLLCGILAGNCPAQDMHIYTLIYDKSKPETEPVARTLTLFHAGRVYDLIDSLEEVIIFEPSQDRFIVLNTKLRLKAEVHINEIRAMMKAARKVTRQRIAELRKKGDAASKATAEMLAFQLDPKFNQAFNGNKKQLTLASRHLRYEAKFAEFPMQQTADTWRKYADWIVQLNFVLYPRVVMPASRQVLNKQLAAKKAIPTEVVLTLNSRPRVKVLAEHTVRGSLDRKDRDKIEQWNSRLKDKSVRLVTLREYQQQLGLNRASRD